MCVRVLSSPSVIFYLRFSLLLLFPSSFSLLLACALSPLCSLALFSLAPQRACVFTRCTGLFLSFSHSPSARACSLLLGRSPHSAALQRLSPSSFYRPADTCGEHGRMPPDIGQTMADTRVLPALAALIALPLPRPFAVARTLSYIYIFSGRRTGPLLGGSAPLPSPHKSNNDTILRVNSYFSFEKIIKSSIYLSNV